MGVVRSFTNRLRSLWRPPLRVWYDPAYRLPLPALEALTGLETRRADLALWSLMALRVVRQKSVHAPSRIRYSDLALVHSAEYLESLDRPEVLAGIFTLDPGAFPCDEVMTTLRLACGGTLQAARYAWRFARPTFNLLGGFHHAGIERGAGLCVLNDIAVAVACLRREGLRSTVAILDLDAHPPDGLAECLEHDRDVWIGSISAVDWGQLPGVDETVLPHDSGDATYALALERLLSRMPQAELTFVIAGGDVLKDDHMGALALSMDGARQRDLVVAEALGGRASVWLPGGGYSSRAWKVVAGSGLAVAWGSRQPIPADHHPMSLRFARVAASIQPEALEGSSWLTEDELLEVMGLPSRQGPRRLLGYYTIEGLEYGLERYGFLAHLRRLGFEKLRVEVGEMSEGQRFRLYGTANEEEHVLVESGLSRGELADRPVLYINWLTLRNPLERFSARRPQLPGQEVPGLGMAEESLELLSLMARRLGLEAVAFRPAHYHVAYAARHRLAFLDEARQGRFEAMLRDLGSMSLLKATRAVDGRRVWLNGQPYAWESEPMVAWLEPVAPRRDLIDAAAAAAHFEVRQESWSDGSDV